MKKGIYLLSCGILNTAALLSGAVDLTISFFAVPLLYLLGGIYLLRVNPFNKKWIGYLSIFGIYPTMLLSAFIGSFFYDGFMGYPLVIITAISIILAFLLYKKSKQVIIRYSFILVIAFGILTALVPNYYNYLNSETNNPILDKQLTDLELYNEFGEKINIEDFEGKVLILDIWSSSCGICISEFPKFDAVTKKYSDDKNVKFFSVNLPLKRDKREEIEKYTNPYSFSKLYAGEDVQKKLNITLIPKYIIIDKNLKPRYVGSLNTRTFDIYKNLDRLINDLKNEK
ncbi:TlpA family protein disulfide reductase [Flavobacterium salilacus subsp. salilacus]|uniref:TlpA family protein disulfide reductase n=1 Tax=Flavobacterium TaxID=237 RepID=UPI001074E0C7|nr:MULTISPECIES: TlpA disulfide reductase family protein [Flavobacterium]KAF2519001.1 TlpA family protein disulfide reductase [Flavobacterium salilacus subsp. salilacus]MBE1614836.1 TlpA family protein disulfide reductase [Flavobacterium sp. SaA2.13]